MPDFSDKAASIARNMKALLKKSKAGVAPGASPGSGERRGPEGRRRVEIEAKQRELGRITTELRAAKRRGDRPERFEQLKRAKRLRQEIFHLQTGSDAQGPETGALPDFAVIGGAKCGTTFFYHVLVQHPHIEPAAMKETQFFNRLFDEGVEWYRGCFPPPRRKDGRMTITGDGTPGYLFHPLAPERMARVVPGARLISVLRNPVDRAFSAYHHRVRNGSERRPFEVAVDRALEMEAHRTSEDRTTPKRDDASPDRDVPHGFISNGVYVDHLTRWSQHYPRERMLVVKSEDFFERPVQTLKEVQSFLGLSPREPETAELSEMRRNTGGYEQKLEPAMRRRLEEFFGPHNRRLYEYLGRDLGW